MDWDLFAVLSEEERRDVLRSAHRRRFARREIIFHEGDPGDALHLLASGRVALRVTTPLGDMATLAVLGPGQYFGEMALISPASRNSTALALEPVETLTLHRDRLDELRERHREIDRFLLDALMREVRRLSHSLLEALYVPVDKRVLRRLADLATLYADGTETTMIPLTQEDLAQLAGTTRPTANTVLRRAEEAGDLRISRGRIEILNADGLARRAR
jgi:CRP/FNR family cyclic AMP-dependent transcriptional regulator